MKLKLWSRLKNSPNSLKTLAGFLIITILFNQLILPIFSDNFKSIYNHYTSISFSIDIFVGFALTLSIISWLIIELRTQSDNEDIKNLKETIFQQKNIIENLRKLVKQMKIDSEIDDTTGIPNEMKFRNDISDIINRDNASEFCLIYIDIDKFKEYNSKYRWILTNKIIRTLAQNIESAMRRDEHVFKRSMNPVDNTKNRQDIYRRFPGGDEFLLITLGTENDGLGFVCNRLPRIFNSTSEALHDVSPEINLSFSGALKFFSHTEILKLRETTPASQSESINRIITELQILTETAKNKEYGFWFLWKSLPREQFLSRNAIENIQLISDEKTKEILTYFSKPKECVFKNRLSLNK